MVNILLTFVFLAGIIVRPESFLWPLHQCYTNKHIENKYLTIFFSKLEAVFKTVPNTG